MKVVISIAMTLLIPAMAQGSGAHNPSLSSACQGSECPEADEADVNGLLQSLATMSVAGQGDKDYWPSWGRARKAAQATIKAAANAKNHMISKAMRARKAAQARFGNSLDCGGTCKPANFVQFDGRTKTYVPRKLRASDDYVSEVLYRYPMESNGIKIMADGRARVPFMKLFQSEFSRDQNSRSRSDYGGRKSMWFKANAVSMISSKVQLMIVDKVHVLQSPNQDYPTHSKDRVLEERRKGGASTDPKFNLVKKKIGLINKFVAGGVSPQVIGMAKDFNQHETLRAFVAHGDGKWTERAKKKVAHFKAQMKERAKLAATRALRSSLSCTHIESIEGVDIVEGKHVDIPLGKKMVAFNGRIAFSPNQEYDMSSGFVVFEHNEAENTLDVYFGFSSVGSISYTGSDSYTASFDVGHADGQTWPIPVEGRKASNEMNLVFMALYKAQQLLPADYGLLYKSKEEAGCTASMGADFAKMARAAYDNMVAKATAGDSMRDTMQLMDTFDAAAFCAVEWLRPDGQTDHTAHYGRFEAMGTMHFLYEIPPDVIAEVFWGNGSWNHLSGVAVMDDDPKADKN